MTDLIITKENNAVFTIILNRLDKKNALNNLMYKQLCQHFDYAKNNNNINCARIVFALAMIYKISLKALKMTRLSPLILSKH